MMNGEIKDEEVTDALPDDLDVHGFVGPYQFPDNSRRRIPGFLYLFFSIVFFLLAKFFDSSPFTNWGYVAAAITLALVGIYHLQGGWKLSIDETDALVEAAKLQVSRSVTLQLKWFGEESGVDLHGESFCTQVNHHRPKGVW